MADFLNLYKIENKKTGQIGNFITSFELGCFLSYLKSKNENLDNYNIYSILMPNVTKILDTEKLMREAQWYLVWNKEHVLQYTWSWKGLQKWQL